MAKPKPPRPPKGVRQPLSDRDGAIATRGPAEESAFLRHVLETAAGEDPDHLTHGFHSYPARMHPAVAREIIAHVEATRLLDPFCGSGTTLVEARVAGLHGTGVDLNPLALRVAEVKVALQNDVRRERFLGSLAAVAEASFERVQGRVDSRAPLSPEERRWYEVHTLKELAGIFEEVQTVEPPEDLRALEMLFSAILHKFSRQRADTAEDEVPRRIRKGLPTEFFVRKGEELLERWAALERACPPRSPSPRLREGDARRHREKGDLIVTSPPYGGTYDYLHHHRRRLAWLKLDVSRLARGEIGARRRQEEGPERWNRELGEVFQGFERALPVGGHAFVLLGDARFGAKKVDAEAQVKTLLEKGKLSLVASAAQRRAEWLPAPKGRGGKRASARREHLLWLRRS